MSTATPLELLKNGIPTDWMSWESKVYLRNFVRNVQEENAYSPDIPELFQNTWHYVFTYGTLKRDFSRHVYMKSSEVVGSGFTLSDKFLMYRIKGDKGFPIIFPVSQSKDSGAVFGELYRCPTDIIPYLDFMESNGTLYNRVKLPVHIRIKGTEDYTTVDAWTYVGNMEGWKKYMSQKEMYLCDRQEPRLHSKDPYYIYMKKYEKEAS